MPKTFANLIDEVQSALGDNTTTFTDAIVTVQLEDALREYSDYDPRIVQYTYELESRTGTATSTLSTWLVDSAAQFIAATDVDKDIFNTTDRTWAKVISNGANSSTQLNLNKDIMASGDTYEMFNKGCWTKKQINIGDITDYVGPDHGVIAVEYKTRKTPRNFRNFKVEGDILTIDIDDDPPDSSSSTADIEVHVWIRRRHQVTQQTLTTIYVDNGSGYSEGDTSIATDYDEGTITGTIKEGTNFTIHETRGDYMVTADATYGSDHVTLQIFPPLENDIADDKTIWLMKSSLNNSQERLVVDLAAARLGMAKFANSITKGGQATYSRSQSKLGIVLSELGSGQKPETSRVWPKD